MRWWGALGLLVTLPYPKEKWILYNSGTETKQEGG